jgi:hypothetical protein
MNCGNKENFSRGNEALLDSVIESKDAIDRRTLPDDIAYRSIRWWYRLADPFIFITAVFFAILIRTLIILYFFYSLYFWPIYKKISFHLRRKGSFLYSKIPKHVAIYTSRNSPKKLHLNRLLEKCFEYNFDTKDRIEFLSIIIDNDIEDFHDYIIYDEYDLLHISLYQNYIPVMEGKGDIKLVVNFLRKDGCEHYLSILNNLSPEQHPKTSDQALALISDKFPVFDLIIVLNRQLVVTGCMPFYVTFSEIAHFPCTKSDWCIDIIFDEAIKGFSKCKQNFGK